MLLRKNLMIEDENWKALKLLKTIEGAKNESVSISKIANEAIRMFLEKEKEHNLAFKFQMLSSEMCIEEEEEILKELSEMSRDELKPSKVVEI